MNTARAAAGLTAGSATSADGTEIGYLRVGTGPAVVLLHGGNESARSHTQLALALAGAFTVYLPDRRGRGRSGPHRPGHGLRTEVEDLSAVMARAGAELVFGVSTGAVIALSAARAGSGIRRVAAYEPALLLGDARRHTGWIGRFDRELAAGKVGAGLITSLHGLDLAPPAFRLMPRPLAEALTSAAMKAEDGKAGPDAVTMRQLAPTVRYEGLLLAETAGTLAAFADVAAEVLLLGGEMKRPGFIRPAFDALGQTLPRSRQAVFAGLDHGGSSDPGPSNRAGKPAVVAPQIRAFFAQR
ncbi:MAG TPA: alpha/beta fold hydrolase [Streptosporangiaceae bacterium]|jgi:pimeloyl-ACP methyl ester carboxylesterase